VQVEAKLDPPPYRRSGFELASWDGARWTLEGIYDSAPEAAQEARHLLGKRLGVKVTEEVFAEEEGVFKGRIVLTEFRDGVPRPQRKPEPAAAPVRPSPRRVVIQAAGNDNSMMVAITALAISVASLLLAMMR
jgi:hypothetical protein